MIIRVAVVAFLASVPALCFAPCNWSNYPNGCLDDMTLDCWLLEVEPSTYQCEVQGLLCCECEIERYKWDCGGKIKYTYHRTRRTYQVRLCGSDDKCKPPGSGG
ncbi:MAG: hypothetical protein IH851_02270 [Armatimonadetes bacterium]|nr:hypothetical protein [Armatimonadota bacterium]